MNSSILPIHHLKLGHYDRLSCLIELELGESTNMMCWRIIGLVLNGVSCDSFSCFSFQYICMTSISLTIIFGNQQQIAPLTPPTILPAFADLLHLVGMINQTLTLVM